MLSVFLSDSVLGHLLFSNQVLDILLGAALIARHFDRCFDLANQGPVMGYFGLLSAQMFNVGGVILRSEDVRALGAGERRWLVAPPFDGVHLQAVATHHLGWLFDGLSRLALSFRILRREHPMRRSGRLARVVSGVVVLLLTVDLADLDLLLVVE